MLQIAYDIATVLIVLTALAVFACVFHAYYQDYKETPRIKKPNKVFWYMVTFIAGVGIIVAGQLYFQDSEYVQNLHEAWRGFEGIYRQHPSIN